MERKLDDGLFNLFDLLQAKCVLHEYDYLLDIACEHYKCDRDSPTAKMFLAFAYASQMYRKGELH